MAGIPSFRPCLRHSGRGSKPVMAAVVHHGGNSSSCDQFPVIAAIRRHGGNSRSWRQFPVRAAIALTKRPYCSSDMAAKAPLWQRQPHHWGHFSFRRTWPHHGGRGPPWWPCGLLWRLWSAMKAVVRYNGRCLLWRPWFRHGVPVLIKANGPFNGQHRHP